MIKINITLPEDSEWKDAFKTLIRGDAAKALNEFERVLADEPEQPLLWFGKGEALRLLSRIEEALRAFDQSTALDSELVVAWYRKGVLLHDSGLHRKALDCFQRVIGTDESIGPAWSGKGHALDGLERYQEALSAFDHAIKLGVNDVETLCGRGNALRKIGRYPEALKSYGRAVAVKPDFAGAWYSLGTVLHELNRHEEALASHARSIKLDPGFALPRSGQGTVYNDLKQYDKALDAFQHALNIDPTLTAAWGGRGNALKELKRYEEALASYDRFTELEPEDPIPFVGRGNVQNQRGLYSNALAEHDRALGIDSACAEAWNGRGSALNHLSRYNEALKAFDQSIALAPYVAIPWLNRALALDGLGRVAEAHGSRVRVIYLLTQHQNRLQPAGAELLTDIIAKYASTQAVPLLLLSLLGQHGLLNVFLRAPDFFSAAEENAQPYLALLRYSQTDATSLDKQTWQRVLGLGAYYLGDPFRAQEHFSALDDMNEDDLLGQFYYAQTYDAYLNPDGVEGVLSVAREHARATLEAVQKADEVAPEQLYYAGHLFLIGDDPQPLLALRCFEEAAKYEFLPALYMKALVQDGRGLLDERDDTIRSILEEERLLGESGRHGFLGGVAIGHIEVNGHGWEEPFHKYAHASELHGALDLMYEWLNKYEEEHERLPGEWSFVDQRAPEELEKAWNVWQLTDQALMTIQEAVEKQRKDQLRTLRARIRDPFPNFLDTDKPAEELEREIAQLIDISRAEDDWRPHLNLIRYLTLSERLSPKPALLLALYTLVRHPTANLNELAEEAAKGGLTHLLEQPANALLVLFGLGGHAVGGPLAAAANAALVHLVIQHAHRARKKRKHIQTFGEFKRDYYQFITSKAETLTSDMAERLTALTSDSTSLMGSVQRYADPFEPVIASEAKQSPKE